MNLNYIDVFKHLGVGGPAVYTRRNVDYGAPVGDIAGGKRVIPDLKRIYAGTLEPFSGGNIGDNLYRVAHCFIKYIVFAQSV